MRALSAAELLSIWEKGLAQSPIRQALLLLNIACPEESLEVLKSLSIGQRDSLLLTLREWMFGSQLVSISKCPNCGERLEFDFTVADIRAKPEIEVTDLLSARVEEYEMQFRLPNSLDLESMNSRCLVSANLPQANLVQHLLLERCLISATYQGKACEIAQLSSHAIEAAIAQMERADPQADVRLALDCLNCNHSWLADFDIVTYFWQEIQTWAYRTLREVHRLASAYGWSEADILAMSPQRRQLYLAMVVP
ncbi:MAG: phage baseplate protein [Cyanobacteria bacterium P01_G01_bin.67]